MLFEELLDYGQCGVVAPISASAPHAHSGLGHSTAPIPDVDPIAYLASLLGRDPSMDTSSDEKGDDGKR